MAHSIPVTPKVWNLMAYDDNNIFARILRDEASAYQVFEDDETMAFLDVMPLSDGHTLVLSKMPAENLFSLVEPYTSAVFRTAQHVARGVDSAFEPDGIRLMQLNRAAAGQTVFHFHLHIIPCYAGVAEQKHGGKLAEAKTLEICAQKLRDAIAGL